MYTFSTEIKEFSNNSINLRKELSLLEDSFSIDMLYIRNNNYVRCDCFNDVEKTGNPKCKKCFGSGYFASIEKIRAIESSISPYSSNNETQLQPIGAINYKEEVYYMEYKVKPKQRDYILKISWKDNLPIDVIQVLEVANIYEMRGDNGRVDVYGTHITNRPDKVKLFNQVLHQLPNKAKKILSNGGKFIWPKNLLI